MKKLGTPESEKQNKPGEKSDKENKEKSDGSSEKPEQNKDADSPADTGENAEKDEKKDSAERKLELLDDEADKLREAIRRQRNMRRAPVEKDW